MSDFSQPGFTAPLLISSLSKYTAAAELSWLNGLAGASNLTSRSWPSASLGIYIPLTLPFPYPVARVFIANGATVTKNFDIGVFTSDGARIFSTGAQAQSGASALQYVTVSPQILLPPGSYYLAVTMSGTNGTTFATNSGTVIAMRMSGCLQQASITTLPASATFAAVANAFWPLFGLTRTTTGF